MTNTSRVTFTGKDVDRLVETVASLPSFAEDEAAATCDNEENANKAWDAADNARELLEEIERKRNASALPANHATAATAAHDLDRAEGCKPDINIQRNPSPTAMASVVRGLDKAEGDQPDLNFHLLQLAERSCSLLEDWMQISNAVPDSLADQVRQTRTLLESQRPTWSVAVQDILSERRRQMHQEGYTPEGDDRYTQGQLADAACAYAFRAKIMHLPGMLCEPQPATWPWGGRSWKPTNQRGMLVKAGALILAELDRLDRQEQGKRS